MALHVSESELRKPDFQKTQKSNVVIRCRKTNDERLLRNAPAVDIDTFPEMMASAGGRNQNVYSRNGWNIEIAKSVEGCILY